MTVPTLTVVVVSRRNSTIHSRVHSSSAAFVVLCLDCVWDSSSLISSWHVFWIYCAYGLLQRLSASVSGFASKILTSAFSSFSQNLIGPDKFQCHLCPREFGSSRTLERHQLRIHLTSFKFQCAFCPEQDFNYPESLRKHLKSNHGTEHLMCHVCAYEARGGMRDYRDHFAREHQIVVPWMRRTGWLYPTTITWIIIYWALCVRFV